MGNKKTATGWFFIGFAAAIVGLIVTLSLIPPTYYRKRFPK